MGTAQAGAGTTPPPPVSVTPLSGRLNPTSLAFAPPPPSNPVTGEDGRGTRTYYNASSPSPYANVDPRTGKKSTSRGYTASEQGDPLPTEVPGTYGFSEHQSTAGGAPTGTNLFGGTSPLYVPPGDTPLVTDPDTGELRTATDEEMAALGYTHSSSGGWTLSTNVTQSAPKPPPGFRSQKAADTAARRKKLNDRKEEDRGGGGGLNRTTAIQSILGTG